VITGRRTWPTWVVIGLGVLVVALYAFTDHNGEVDEAVLWVAAAGQVGFVLLWGTQRWWSTTVGRALFGKSLALGAILAASVWSVYNGPLPIWLGRALFGAVTVTILGQLLALSLEILAARREARSVSGMPPRES